MDSIIWLWDEFWYLWNTIIMPYAIPYFGIQFLLQFFALAKLKKVPKTKYLNKPVWSGIILFAGLPGALSFLLIRPYPKKQSEDDVTVEDGFPLSQD